MTNSGEQRFLRWIRPPRRTLLLYSGLTLILTITIGFQGIQLISRNLQLIDQQISDELLQKLGRVENEFSLRFSRLADELTTISRLETDHYSQHLTQRSAQSPQFDLFIAADRNQIYSRPSDLLPYPPYLARLPSPITYEYAFLDAERLELREHDYESALALYRSLSTDEDLGIAVMAYFRIGRCLQAIDQLEEAESVYLHLTQYDDVLIREEPSSLLALIALHDLYARTDQDSLCRGTISDIRRGLLGHRWQITFDQFKQYAHYPIESSASAVQLEQYRGESALISMTSETTAGLAYSAVVDSLWRSWTLAASASTLSEIHHGIVLYFGKRVVFSALRTSERLYIVLTNFTHLIDAQSELHELIADDDYTFSLSDREGRIVFEEQPNSSPHHESIYFEESLLPFSLSLARENATSIFSGAYQRIRFLAVGFTLVILTVLIAGFSLSRAVMKEINLARLQSDFVSAVSHEFRSPLTSIRQLSELIAQDRYTSADQRDEYFNVISAESMRLHRLVEDLLDFRRMEAGAKDYHMRPVDIQAMVKETIEVFEADVMGRESRIRQDYEIEEVPVYGDREMLVRALWNLLDNAVRYSPGDPSIEVALRNTDNQVQIAVTDHGLGIPAEEQKRIFNKFVRGQAAQRTVAKGSGLGLSIVQQIIEAHQGRVFVKSKEGVGSTFTISLPIWREPATGTSTD